MWDGILVPWPGIVPTASPAGEAQRLNHWTTGEVQNWTRFFFFFFGSLLQCVVSLVVACRLSCSATCGILVLWPGIKPESPAMEDGFLTAGPPGKSLFFFNRALSEACFSFVCHPTLHPTPYPCRKTRLYSTDWDSLKSLVQWLAHGS